MSQKPAPPVSARASADAGQACRECRRRKGKCDGKLPVCSLCQKYNRHCLYDKHSRSALTRKHLTEVEERLERAETLLRTIFSEPELARLLGNGLQKVQTSATTTAELSSPPQSSLRSPFSLDEQITVPPATDSSNVFADQWVKDASFPQNTAGHNSDARSLNGSVPTTLSPAPTENPGSLYDTVPSAADDDFEWDESEALWTSFEPGGKSSSIHGTDAAALRKITDGMATLNANDSNTGFLGPVSGAALLQMISEGHGRTPNSDDILEVGGDRRNGVVDLLGLQLTENAMTSSWLAAQPILNRAFVDTLVESFFAHYHPTFPILHEHTFRLHYQSLNERPKGIWHTLAHLVAALGAFVSSNCPDSTDIYLFNAMKSQLTIESLETGSLGLVQAFAMAANYLQKRNRPNSGYNYGGVALRLAISLGLHKEFQHWETALVKKEIRRRVWWTLCVLDVGATVTYGRPLNWPQAGVEAHFPLNIREKDLVISSTSMPNELTEATLYSYIRTQSGYHLATIRIYNRLITSPLPSASELLDLDDKCIDQWRCELPLYYCDANLPLPNEHLLGHTIGRCRYRVFRIMMLRPFLLRWASDGFQTLQNLSPEHCAVTRCLTAAEECISVLAYYWTTATHTRLSAWYVLYFLLQAVLIPVHCLRSNRSHMDTGNWINQVQTALGVINAMVEINPSALKCRDIILRLCKGSLPRDVLQQNTSASYVSINEQFTSEHQDIDFETASIDSWTREVDSAILEYNEYCNRLTSTTVTDFGCQRGATDGNHMFFQGRPFDVSHRGIESEPGGLDWDWGLSLMH